MACGRVYGGGGSNMTVLVQNESIPSSEVFESLWIPSSYPSFHGDFSGSKSMVNFENFRGEDPTERPFYRSLNKGENDDEEFDGCFHQPEKKRRLTADQVHFLEKNFEVENKLEPERKVQLAKELGLQPRQIAIWFQNRRARFKTKQMEKDYDSLKARYDNLKADYDCLLKEKGKLNNEVLLLKDKLLLRDKKRVNSETNYPSDSSHAEPQKPTPNSVFDNLSSEPMVVVWKQEDASSAKSDVFDSDSSHYTDGNHSSLLEPADSSHVFEPEQSDFSQDEEDNKLSQSLLPSLFLPKLEDDCYHDPPANTCNFGFPVEDPPFWFWSC
ncbi:hypothetical protein L1049_006954 [Liquidambar formosana]|uniref:Homeobox-leucine zipper protein n=1 Tax=Liquidambar formosana TaxID=63359 RepID=A0AAP0RJS9_LIQFO